MKNLTFLLLSVALFCTSCSEDDDGSIQLAETEFTLRSGDTVRPALSKGNYNTIKWTTNNEYVAAVSLTGMIKAQRIGTATVKANGEPCYITVVPTIELYDEPLTEWGIHRKNIYPKLGEPLMEGDDYLIYETPDGVVGSYTYALKNDELFGCSVLLPMEYFDSLVQFMDERYARAKARHNDVIACYIDSLDWNSVSTVIFIYPYSEWLLNVYYLDRNSVDLVEAFYLPADNIIND